MSHICSFFFRAADGIRDADVTGVQTCALPIYLLTPSDFLKRFRHGVQVTHTVIKDGDGLSHNQPFSVSVPLVDGVMFAIRSSASTAMRRARPNALNTVSAWWCAFLPRKLSMCTVSMPWLTMP